MPRRDLEVDIDGDPSGFIRAAKLAEAQAAKFERQLNRMEARLKTTQAALANSKKPATLMRNELLTLAAAGTTVAPAFIAAGAGVTAFAALAAPAILRVVKAQENLSEHWDSLSDAEKTSALGLRNLIGQYKALARELEPETLAVFDQALAATARHMPKLAPIARAVSQELGHFVDRLDQALDSPQATEFFAFLESSAGPATRQLTDLLGSAAGAATSFVQAIAPLASGGLSVVGMLLDLVAAVSQAAPGLTQMAILAVAARGPLGSLGDTLSNAGTRLQEFAARTDGTRTKAQGLGKALSATGGFLAGPWGVAVAAAIGLLGAFAASSADAQARVSRFEQAIRADSGALGAHTRQLTTELLEQEGLLQVAQRSGIALSTYTDAILGNKDAHAQVTAELDRQIAALKQQADAGKLSFEGYKAGVSPLIQLRAALRGQNEAVTAGVESYKRLQAAQQATIPTTDAVKLAWDRASDATLTMKERLDALSAAFDAYFNPALAVLSATNRMKEAVAASNKVLENSEASNLDRRRALENQLGVLRDWAQAEFRATGNVKKSSEALHNQLPALTRLAGKSREGKAAIDTLITAMGGTITRVRGVTTAVDRFGNKVKILPNGKVVIIKADTSKANSALDATKGKINSIQGKTVFIDMIRRDFGITQPTGAPFIKKKAAGGHVRGPGSGTSDSIPAWLSNGEYVMPASRTARYWPILEAMRAGAFAEGGPVGYAAGGKVRPLSPGSALAELQKASTGRALSKDLQDTISEIKSASKTLTQAVRQAYTAHRISYRTAEALLTRIANGNARLQKLAKQRDDLAERITAAKQFSSSVRDNARSFAGLTGLGDTAAGVLTSGDSRSKDTAQAAAAPTAGGIRGGLSAKLAQLKRFRGVVIALGKRGLAKSLLRQVVEAGPEEGLAYGEALLAASKTDFAAINTTQASILKTSKSLGLNSADLLYDSGKQAGKGFLTGLQSQKKQIVGAMDDIADALVKRIRTRLKIKSPSQVTEGDARQLGAGMIRGMDTMRAPVSAAAVRLAAAAVPAIGARSAGGAAGRGGDTYNITVHGALDPAGTAREIEKVLSRYRRNNGRNSLAFT